MAPSTNTELQRQAETSLPLSRPLSFQLPAFQGPDYHYKQNAKPLFYNRDADWDRLVVEEYQTPSSGEISLPGRRHHALTCQIGKPSRIFRKYHGQIDERIFAPGDFSLCPAGEPASVQWLGEAHILQILLPAQWIAEAATLLGGREAEPLQVCFGAPSPQIAYSVLALQAEVKSGCPGGPLYAETLTSALAVCLLQCSGTQTLSPTGHGSGLGKRDLARVLAYISDHLAEELSLRELAACTQLSLHHFARLFKLSVGLPPHEYVIRQRVEKAKTLLTAGRMTVGEAAQSVGFFDHSSLCRHFKRLTGLSPRQFQRR